VWTCLVVSLVLAITPRSTAQPPRIPLPRIEETAAEEIKEAGIPGAAIAVVRGNDVIYAQSVGVASVDTLDPISRVTLFRLGSTTKMFTAATVVKLAEQGKLKLDAPIGQYVKDLPPFLTKLTLHQLLSHTAGITDEAPMFGRHDDDALGRGIRAWKEDFIFAPPGKVYSYSNPGYWLAGLVAEEVAGKPFADVVDEQIFQPVAMRRTTFRPTLAMTYPLAAGHGPGRPEPTVLHPMANNAATWPAGSIFSNLDDLSRWARVVLNGGRLEGKEVLPPAVIHALSGHHVALPGTERFYGYGLMSGDLRGVSITEHGGSRSGYGSLIRFLPDKKIAIIILTNRTGGQLPRTADVATGLFAQLGSRTDPSQSEEPLSAEEISRLVGKYTNNRETVELSEREGKLYARQGGQERSATKAGPNRLKIRDGEYIVIPGDDGKPEYLHHGGRSYRRVAK
jgi:CubicO group peptidase (beta-lactamase class C family)